MDASCSPQDAASASVNQLLALTRIAMFLLVILGVDLALVLSP